jgi:hypothetical protein
MTACLDELDMNLVLSEIDMKSDEGKKKLYEQVKTALRKYHSAGALNSHKNTAKTLFNNTQLAQLEDVFVANGWSRSEENDKKSRKAKRKPRKKYDKDDSKKVKKENGFTRDGTWPKCFKCVEDCTYGTQKCDCPASTHTLVPQGQC